jgi:hypothetical protein
MLLSMGCVQPPNGPLTAATSPDTPSTCPATQSGLCSAFFLFMGLCSYRRSLGNQHPSWLVSLAESQSALSVPIYPIPCRRLIAAHYQLKKMVPWRASYLHPSMPIAMQRKKVFIGLLGTAVNSAFNYPNYFSMAPNGPEPKASYTKGFLGLAVRQNPRPQTVAIVAADAEFALNASEGARENVKAAGLAVVYDRRYPSTTTDLVPVVRAIAETNPDL